MDESPAPRSASEPRKDWLAETWEAHRRLGRGLLSLLKAALFIAGPLVLLYSVLGPINPGYRGGHDVRLQQVHTLGLALFYYANDNAQEYPDGASSTEVFQKLMDGGYVTDPMVFYVPMRGKVAPEPGQKKLKPENVCWDVTGGVGSQDSNGVPLVFLTGFRLTYAPGIAARPLGGDFPYYTAPQHFLFFSWEGRDPRPPGIAVFYSGLSAAWIPAQVDSIPNVVPKDFDAHGKTYRQLTPDGVLR